MFELSKPKLTKMKCWYDYILVSKFDAVSRVNHIISPNHSFKIWFLDKFHQ